MEQTGRRLQVPGGDDGQRVRLGEKRKRMREDMEHLRRGRRRLLSSAMKASVASVANMRSMCASMRVSKTRNNRVICK